MKTFTTLFALCVAVTAFAQIEKGRSFITGSASISNRDYKDQDYKSFFTNGSLMYGHLVGDKVAIGLDVSGASNKSESNSTAYLRSLSFSPFVRRYFTLTDKFYFNLDGRFTYGRSREWSVSDTGQKSGVTRSAAYGIWIVPAVTYFATERFAVNATFGSVGYSSAKNTDNSNTTQSSFALDLGIRYFSLGLNWFF